MNESKQDRLILKLLKEGRTGKSIAQELGISTSVVSYVRRLGKARTITRKFREPQVDPTPEEIAERAAEIRAKWPPNLLNQREREFGLPVYSDAIRINGKSVLGRKS